MKYLLFISILLYGCGSENHSYGWSYDYKHNDMRVRGESQLTPDELYGQYEKAVSCLGDKHPPFIIFTDEIESDDKITGRCGQTRHDPPLILMGPCGNQLETFNHELTHYWVRGHGQDFKEGLQCIKQLHTAQKN